MGWAVVPFMPAQVVSSWRGAEFSENRKSLENKLEITNIDSLSIRRHPSGVIFKVSVQPKSARNMVVGLHGDAVKIKLTAPPVDNAANTLCIKFLAKVLGVSRSSLDIIAGHTSRSKQVLLRADTDDVTPEVYRQLEQLIATLVGP